MGSLRPEDFAWLTRPHAAGEPARHVAELSAALGAEVVHTNVWRYEPGARGRRHVHAGQEETYVVVSGTASVYLGEPPVRHDVPAGGAALVRPGTPVQTVNHGDADLVVLAYGSPPDDGAEVLADAV